jgi:hypothetical protein
MGLGSGIRDQQKTYYGFRIQGSKRHRIPDPDPQEVPYNCTVQYNIDTCTAVRG